jgi:alkylation response protein AidB-like acyl-CoA dehydrogenase
MNLPRNHASTDTQSSPLQVADRVARVLAETALARDQRGGTPKAERDLLRESGLLTLMIPSELGGLGETWPTTLAVVRRLAQVDGSVAHVFGFQHLLLATLQLFAAAEQWRPLFASTVEKRWFWGNTLNPLDTRTLLTWNPTGDQGAITGDKSFCSGALDSDMLIVSALQSTDKKFLVAAIPTARAGIELHDDWDNIGQRQTDSGSAHFENVQVSRSELLVTPGPLGSTFASLRSGIAQLILSNIYLGIGQGALQAARAFTLEHSKPWAASGVAKASDDPYVLRNYGEIYTELEAARALTDEAALQLQAAWEKGDAITPQERGHVALAIALSKVKTSSAGLETASRVFEVMGARSTVARARLDRFWRNLRVHTLHDPVDYKLRDLGAFALSEQLPVPSFYS